MAMSVGTDSGDMRAEINVTPLADVMLVLLIIFMITAPLMSHKIKVDLPQANPNTKPTPIKVVPIDLAIEPDGSMYWNDIPVSEPELNAKLKVAAQQVPQPELNIRADRTTTYRVIWKAMSDAKDAGMVHLGFITTGGKETGLPMPE
jgi:biopolymer transport protein ExbD